MSSKSIQQSASLLNTKQQELTLISDEDLQEVERLTNENFYALHQSGDEMLPAPIESHFNVAMRNEFNQIGYGLTVNSTKILRALIALVNPLESSITEFYRPYTFKIEDLERSMGLKSKTLFNHGKSYVEEIKNAAFTFSSDSGNKTTAIPFVSLCQYNRSLATITIIPNPQLKPMLTSLDRNYYRYTVREITNLNSTYSIRLFEFFKEKIMGKSSGEFDYTIDELHHRLALKDSYKSWGNMKARCIDPAVNEITNKTQFDVEYIPIKLGRRVTGVRFIIKTSSVDKFDFVPIRNMDEAIRYLIDKRVISDDQQFIEHTENQIKKALKTSMKNWKNQFDETIKIMAIFSFLFSNKESNESVSIDSILELIQKEDAENNIIVKIISDIMDKANVYVNDKLMPKLNEKFFINYISQKPDLKEFIENEYEDFIGGFQAFKSDLFMSCHVYIYFDSNEAIRHWTQRIGYME